MSHSKPLKCSNIALYSQFTHVFLLLQGIPYAQSPSQTARFQEPKDLERINNGSCWEGVLRADRHKPQCSQLDRDTGEVIGMRLL